VQPGPVRKPRINEGVRVVERTPAAGGKALGESADRVTVRSACRAK
jgi:hypothetical protein